MSISDKWCTVNAETFFLYVLYKMFVQHCYEILVVLLNSKVFCQRQGQVKLSELKNSCYTHWQYFIVCVLLAFLLDLAQFLEKQSHLLKK